jgi:sec-independent protein translocase protein TatA
MFGGIGMNEMVIIGIVAVVLFGKQLPSVARSLGGSYREFKKGLTDFQRSFTEAADEITSPVKDVAKSTYQSYDDYDDYEQPTAPKFTLPAQKKDNGG